MTQAAPILAADQAAFASNPAILADIYQDAVNLAVWRAGQCAQMQLEAQTLCQLSGSRLRMAISGTVDELNQQLAHSVFASEGTNRLLQRTQQCVQMFAELFEPPAIGLRLDFLDRAMCPRFHVDHLPVRMITTFSGPATQWLRNQDVERCHLGPAGAGRPDDVNGVIRPNTTIQQLAIGDVALMKGDGWEGNEGAGLVHRSPAVDERNKRLVLTLDWLN